MATRLLLIRHAAVDLGDPPVLCGSLDLPLTRTGRQEALARIARCRGANAPEALYTSPLVRARDTADMLRQAWPLDVRVDDGLREIHCGGMEGLRLEDIARDHPSVWERNRAQDDDDFTWPGGESYRMFRVRVLDTLGRIAGSHEGGRVAAVTHAGVVGQVLGTIRGRPAAVWEIDRPEPFTLTEVIFADGRPESVLTFSRRDWC